MLAEHSQQQFHFAELEFTDKALADAQPVADQERSPQILRFRDCEIQPSSRLLLRHGVQVEIGGRAFDLLVALVQARGCVVSKEEIFRAVWPTTTVDESNLRFQVASLRRTLGRDRDLIKTIAGRGYFFAVDVSRGAPPHTPMDAMFSQAAGSGTQDQGKILRMFFERASELLKSYDSVDDLIDALGSVAPSAAPQGRVKMHA